MGADTLGTIQLGDRDLSLLRGLFESRVMTSEHIAEIYFSGRREYAKKRLQVIKAAGLIAERLRKQTEPAVLYLTAPGMRALRDRGILTQYPAASLPVLQKRAAVSELTIRHELAVMSVKGAFHRSLRDSPHLSIAEFNTWPRLIQFTASRPDGAEVLVKPDGFIRIHEKEPDGSLSEHAFFLEVDRSTEELETLATRAACYLHHYKTGGFAEACGGERSAFKDFPFRVLVVLETEERRNNLAEKLLTNNPPIFTQICLTTTKEVLHDPLAASWITPADYRQAAERAGHTIVPERLRFGYRRQSARDNKMEAALLKRMIIEEAKR